MDPVVFQFGDHQLDLAGDGELRREGLLVPLQPRLLATLIHLVSNAGRVVPLDELRAVVWRGVAGADSAIHQAVGELRRDIGQTRADRYPIETLPKRGYRFVGVRAVGTDKRGERLLWRQYALQAAQAPRTPAECIQLADALLKAEVSRYGAL